MGNSGSDKCQDRSTNPPRQLSKEDQAQEGHRFHLPNVDKRCGFKTKSRTNFSFCE